MIGHDLIRECSRLGIALWLADDGVHFSPASAVPKDLAPRMRAAKHEIAEIFSARSGYLPEGTARSDRSPLLAAMAAPRGGGSVESGHGDALEPGGQADGTDDELGTPQFGCWTWGCREFARDLAGTGWVCSSCHRIEDYRAHPPRGASPHPIRRGGAS